MNRVEYNREAQRKSRAKKIALIGIDAYRELCAQRQAKYREQDKAKKYFNSYQKEWKAKFKKEHGMSYYKYTKLKGEANEEKN